MQLAQRRKLIRGAFAAPAIMTVCTGSAFAATSALRPLVNRCNSPVYMPCSTTTDTWLRVQCWQDTATNTFYVYGGDLYSSYKRPTNTICVGSTNYRQVDFSTNSAGVMAGADCALPSGAARCSKYIGVSFDSNGNVVCVGQGTVGQSHIALTCWTSVAPHI
jgi:hypothetical protein